MPGSGWTKGQGEERDLRIGSRVGCAEMEIVKSGAGSVWCAEEAFLSPPEYGGSLGASCESEESSEDCEDYISGLAKEIAQSMLQEDEEAPKESAPRSLAPLVKSAWSFRHKMATLPSSPQSTLAGMEGYYWEGNTAISRVSSGVSSPPTPREGESRDVLYAELLRLKLEDQVKLTSQQQTLSPHQQIIQRPTPADCALHVDDAWPLDRSCGGNTGKCAWSKCCGQEQNILHAQFRGGCKAQVGGAGSRACGTSGQQQSQPTTGSGVGGGKGILDNVKKRREEQPGQQHHPFSLFAGSMDHLDQKNCGSAGGWMVMMMRRRQQQEEEAGGMRAVFLGNRVQSGGTGVFLPRRLGSFHDARRKADFPPLKPHSRGNPQVASRRTKAKDDVHPCYFPMSHPPTLQEVAPDINLPSEWTY